MSNSYNYNFARYDGGAAGDGNSAAFTDMSSYGAVAGVGAGDANLRDNNNTHVTVTATTTQMTRRLDSAAPKRVPITTPNNNKQQQQYNKSPNPNSYASFLSTSSSSSPTRAKAAALQKQHDKYHPEDTLEYFIKFPTCNTYQRNGYSDPEVVGANDLDFVFVRDKEDDTNVPIVVLLGWAGCQDRYLMKYSKIYEDRGLITIRYTAPVANLFWNRSAMIPIGEKILKLLCDMNFDAHPVIFHIFSNGGAFLYQHISLAMHKYRTPIQIRGMIFDSAPGERRMLGLYRAVTAIYGREKKVCPSLVAMLITVSLSVMWFFEEAYVAFKGLFVKTDKVQTNPFSDLKNEPSQFPQMFLYSKADVIIPYKDVEKFMAIRTQRGVDVSSVLFDDAEHVKIFTKYPSQYIQCVCTFISNCLSRPYNGESFVTTPTSGVDTPKKYD